LQTAIPGPWHAFRLWNISERILEGFGPIQDGGRPCLAPLSGQPAPKEQTMTDLPISQSAATTNAGKIAPAFASLTTLFRTAIVAVAQAAARNAQRRAQRRMPDEILAAHARREEARRAVDKLLRMR
jgi:hypothetical protein